MLRIATSPSRGGLGSPHKVPGFARGSPIRGVDASVAPCTSEEYKAKHPESADRPKWSALDNRMLRCTVGNDVRDWKDALACFFEHWDGDNGMK